MKRLLYTLGFLTMLFAAPTLLACEDCITAGTPDPVGNVSRYDKCWSSSGGLWQGCYINSVGKCETWDYDPTACPSSGGGTGGDGDGGDGSDDEQCKREASGMCPLRCRSCDGGGR